MPECLVDRDIDDDECRFSESSTEKLITSARREASIEQPEKELEESRALHDEAIDTLDKSSAYILKHARDHLCLRKIDKPVKSGSYLVRYAGMSGFEVQWWETGRWLNINNEYLEITEIYEFPGVEP